MKSTWRKIYVRIRSSIGRMSALFAEQGDVRAEAVDARADVDMPAGAPLDIRRATSRFWRIRPAAAGSRRPVVSMGKRRVTETGGAGPP
jgi:hypothetical protein